MNKRNRNLLRQVRMQGGDILNSGGMQRSKGFIQHGSTSVYAHSVSVALESLRLARGLRLRVNERALIRGALLHDYFLYDWHEKDDSHAWHGFIHAERALRNAERDFPSLGNIERNMIYCHMFPLNLLRVPKYRESWLLCCADKLCSLRETAQGIHLFS